MSEIMQNNQNQQLITYVPLRKLSDSQNINWWLIVTKDTAIAFKPQKEFLLLIASTTSVIGLVMILFVGWLVQGNKEIQKLKTNSKLKNHEVNDLCLCARGDDVELCSPIGLGTLHSSHLGIAHFKSISKLFMKLMSNSIPS